MVTEEALAEFEGQRPRLFGLAYRLLGSAEEAEDVVQDAFIRWSSVEREMIIAPSAWLSKVVTNLALNRLSSARARREEYIGPWLPEPVLTQGGVLGPLETAEQRDLVSFAMLVLLERLTPTQRAVFVLREAFAYSFREIAGVMELSEAGCRQLYRRARQCVDEARACFPPDRTQRYRLVERFLAAARDGDLRGLEGVLAADVTSWADGGGKAGSARRPVLGRDRVARYIAGTMGKFAAGLEILLAEVNGEPALVARAGRDVAGVAVPEFLDGRIRTLRIVASPDKLRFAARQVAGLSHSAGLAGS